MTCKSIYGIVVESNTKSWTGPYLYSDYAVLGGVIRKNTKLNELVKNPVLGNFAGIARIALGIIHTIGHLFAFLFSFNRGHLFHSLKGICEIVRGVIETIPIVGQLFSYRLMPEFDGSSWWLIKIYNPMNLDGLDIVRHYWLAIPDRLFFREGDTVVGSHA